MKTRLLDLLICPRCLPDEYPLDAEIQAEKDSDIESGMLRCPHCGTGYPIVAGVALLDPQASDGQRTLNRYETREVVSSYLWSHYGELFDPDNASDAYATWAGLIRPQPGLALDSGGAVGRFTFELGSRCDFAIGIDTSLAFIQASRRLMRQRTLAVTLKEEGVLCREVTIRLPEEWRSDRVEFVVANALALPLRSKAVAVFSSLNLVDKVPAPLQHLREMNRVTADRGAQFLFSDPFSWSTEAAPVTEWLGGTAEGRFAGRGLANVAALLADPQGELTPVWLVAESGDVWWKIRTHCNHYELIRSCYVHACR